MKITKKILLICIFATTLLYFYFPLKIAKYNIDYINSEYIICRITKTTGFDWSVVDSSDGYKGLAFLEGNVIKINNLQYPIEWGNNTYVMYVEKKGKHFFDGEEYPIYDVMTWEILYPVKREMAFDFLSPSYGVTLSDFK